MRLPFVLMSEAGTVETADAPKVADAPLEEHSPLLKVQRLDTEIEQLRHQRSGLPQREKLRAARAERDAIRRQMDETAAQRAETLMRQNRLEGEAGVLEADAEAKNAQLYSGEVRALKGLEALQHEIRSLRDRQNHLEEKAIEALIEADDLRNDLKRIETEAASLSERVTVLEAELDAAAAEIDMTLTESTAARDAAAAVVDAEVLLRYERRRAAFGYLTAVAFDPVSGCSCPIAMPKLEAARIARCEPPAVLDCSECGRMVVR